MTLGRCPLSIVCSRGTPPILSPESQGQNLALTGLFVPSSLDSRAKTSFGPECAPAQSGVRKSDVRRSDTRQSDVRQSVGRKAVGPQRAARRQAAAKRSSDSACAPVPAARCCCSLQHDDWSALPYRALPMDLLNNPEVVIQPRVISAGLGRC